LQWTWSPFGAEPFDCGDTPALQGHHGRKAGKDRLGTVRNPKLDTRSARAKLVMRDSLYWVPLAPGCALGYRKGPKGGVWVAKIA
jgi:hypothetical protein